MVSLRKVLTALWLLPTILLSGFSPSYAGDFDQDFVDRLATTPRTAAIKGVVCLDEQLDIGQIKQEIERRGLTTRAERHRFVIESAIELAQRSQSDLIARLEQRRNEGTVVSVRSYWVMNAVLVEALPEVFDEVVERVDIGMIYDNSKAELRTGWDEPDREVTGGDRDLPNNLICVNVQPAWDLGFRGQGRIVCTFDSGADGSHEAFASRWRGLQPGVNWWEAWRDPYTGTEFPYDGRTSGHGTHVMGIITGEMPDGTPIGVAPEAWWIAAGATIEWDFDKIIECYQWAADPDGNPETIDDVPDVVNNSWGTSADCDDTFWAAIDVVEAAGVVNTIAVDNRGPNPYTVNSPESRAASATVNWGVGNVNPHDPAYPISTTSGRGPSPCDSVSIKPEVSAPGTLIYSTLPGSTYGNKTGTSMACPHTSGTVALMRQIDPDLTVDDIKWIMMKTAVDKGDAGEDNAYGWGIIDIGAAIDSVRRRLPRIPPQNLTATVEGDSVRLQWDRPSPIHQNNNLIRYRIFRAPIEQIFAGIPIAEVVDTSSVVTYLDPSVPYDQYHYAVSALYEVAESGLSDEANAAVFPSRPARNLTASVAVDTVRLEWERPDSIHVENPISTYRLFRAPLEEPFGVDPIAELSDTSAVVSSLDIGPSPDTYHYVVEVSYLYNASGPSNEAEATVFPFGPPRNLSAFVWDDSVGLSWERPDPLEPGNPVESYRLFRTLYGQPFGTEPIAEVIDTSAVVTHVDGGVPFDSLEYLVRAVYASAVSDTSNHTAALEEDWMLPPDDLTFSVSADTVDLSWSRPGAIHPANPLQRYRLFRALEGEPFGVDPIAEIETDFPTISYSDSGVPFAGHRYAVTALYLAGESDTSQSVDVATSEWMRPPQSLTTTVSVDTVRLEWTKPSPLHPDNPVLLYRLFRAPAGDPLGGEPIAEISDTLAVPAYVDSGLPDGTYEYAVTALYTPGESDTCSHASATIYPRNPPQNLSSAIVADTVHLQWERPDPVHPDHPVLLYRIYRSPLGEPFPNEPLAEVGDTLDVPSYSDSGVPYVSLQYAVTALYASAESDTSNHQAILKEDWTRPPSELIASVTADTVRLEWDRPDPTHPDDALQGYRLYRSRFGEAFNAEPLAEVSEPGLHVIHLDPAVPLDSLQYAVTAVYASAESDTSSHAVVLEEVWKQPPTDLMASVAADTVRLEWSRPDPNHPEDPLQSYRLYRTKVGVPFGIDPLAELFDSGNQIVYFDPTVPLDSLQYMVTAVYLSAESDSSNNVIILEEVWFTPPTNLTASVSADTVHLEWERPSPIHPDNPLLSYRLYRALEEDPFPIDPLAEIVDSLGVVAYQDVGVPYDSYHYVVSSVYSIAESAYSDEVVVIVYSPAGAEEIPGQPNLLLEIVPNPFNPIASIRYQPVGEAPLSISVYDVTGARVRRLVEETHPNAGPHTAVWNGRDDSGRPVASGAYFIRFEQGRRVTHRRIVLLK